MTAPGFDLASAILILLAAVIPIYFCIQLKNNFRILMMVLSIFAIIHGTYHILEVVGYEILGENYVEPISYAVLICFGLYYLKIRAGRKIEA